MIDVLCPGGFPLQEHLADDLQLPKLHPNGPDHRSVGVCDCLVQARDRVSVALQLDKRVTDALLQTRVGDLQFVLDTVSEIGRAPMNARLYYQCLWVFVPGHEPGEILVAEISCGAGEQSQPKLARGKPQAVELSTVGVVGLFDEQLDILGIVHVQFLTALAWRE